MSSRCLCLAERNALLMRSVKSAIVLLLTRVTEARELERIEIIIL